MPLSPTHRFSIESFRRYETAIQSICLNYPNGTTINPTPFSAETFCARCRDAIRAYLDPRNVSWSSVVERDLLARVRDDIVFTHDGTSVFVAPRATIKNVQRHQFATASGLTGRATQNLTTTHANRPFRISSTPALPQASNEPGALPVLETSSTLRLETNSPTEEQILALLDAITVGQVQNLPITLTGVVPMNYLNDLLSSGKYDVEYKLLPDMSVILF